MLNSEEDWDEFKDQLLMFPAQGVHDDLPDALSYIDQLAVTSYFVDDQEDEWEPLDIICPPVLPSGPFGLNAGSFANMLGSVRIRQLNGFFGSMFMRLSAAQSACRQSPAPRPGT